MKGARIGTRTRVHLQKYFRRIRGRRRGTNEPRYSCFRLRRRRFLSPPSPPSSPAARVPVPRVVADLDPELLFRETCARLVPRSVPRSVPAPRLPAVPPLQVLHRPRRAHGARHRRLELPADLFRDRPPPRAVGGLQEEHARVVRADPVPLGRGAAVLRAVTEAVLGRGHNQGLAAPVRASLEGGPRLYVAPRRDDDDEREPPVCFFGGVQECVRVLCCFEKRLRDERRVHLERPALRSELEERPQRPERAVYVRKRRAEPAVTAVERRRKRLAPHAERASSARRTPSHQAQPGTQPRPWPRTERAWRTSSPKKRRARVCLREAAARPPSECRQYNARSFPACALETVMYGFASFTFSASSGPASSATTLAAWSSANCTFAAFRASSSLSLPSSPSSLARERGGGPPRRGARRRRRPPRRGPPRPRQRRSRPRPPPASTAGSIGVGTPRVPSSMARASRRSNTRSARSAQAERAALGRHGRRQSRRELKSAKFHGGARRAHFRGWGARALAAGGVVLARATLVNAFQVFARCFRELLVFVEVPLHRGVPQRGAARGEGRDRDRRPVPYRNRDRHRVQGSPARRAHRAPLGAVRLHGRLHVTTSCSTRRRARRSARGASHLDHPRPAADTNFCPDSDESRNIEVSATKKFSRQASPFYQARMSDRVLSVTVASASGHVIVERFYERLPETIQMMWRRRLHEASEASLGERGSATLDAAIRARRGGVRSRASRGRLHGVVWCGRPAVLRRRFWPVR